MFPKSNKLRQTQRNKGKTLNILMMKARNEKRLIMAGGPNVGVKVGNKEKWIDVGHHCVVMSGYAELAPYGLNIVEDQPMFGLFDIREWEAQVIIGPVWRDVFQCSPMVAPGYFYDHDADEDDEQGLGIMSGCSWDEVEDNGKKRIWLKFKMTQYGEDYRFIGVEYHAVATGHVTDYKIYGKR
jgi:hypothetical protein